MTKPFERREVLVPMVGVGASGAVARVAADGDLPAPHPAQLDRELSDLLECGLYQAGQQAKAAVRTLHRRGGGLLGRPPTALSVMNPGEVVGLGAENSSSAELGLALALLAYQAQIPDSAAMASGALDLAPASGEVRVLPVERLDDKLHLLAEHFSQPGSAKPPRFLLLPKQDPDGAEVEERYANALVRLCTLGVEARCIATLKEAVRAIGAERVALRRTEQRARLGALLVLGLLGCGAGLLAFMDSGIPLAFSSAAAPDGRILPTPLRIVKQDQIAHLEPACILANGMPGYEIHDEVGARVQVLKGTHDPTHFLGGYHFMAVSWSEGRAPHATLPREWSVEGQAQYLWNVIEPPGDTTLIFLARRGEGFNADKLLADLIHSLTPLKASEWDSATRNFLRDAAPGVLVYRFRTMEPGSCR
jgi:hypothetical protein